MVRWQARIDVAWVGCSTRCRSFTTGFGDPLTGHTDWVRSVAVGQVEGRPVIVSGGDDATVRVWDAATGTPVGDPLTGHTGYVNAVAVGQVDGRPVIVSGSDDATVRVWDLAAFATQKAARHSGEDTDAIVVDVAAGVLAVAVRAGLQVAVATRVGIVSLRIPM
jgi:WD40 repeat protein